MDDSRLHHLIGASLIALLAGAVSYFVWLFVFVYVGLWTGFIVIFGPQPKQPEWFKLCVYGSITFAAGIVAWLTFRLLDSKYSRR
jgi:hypothetical protein